MFSVQLDTTQDVSAKDQYSVVVRYVEGNKTVKERLFALIDAEASTGLYYVNMLRNCLDDAQIPLSMCIRDSTDGASNMQGIYRGFSTLLELES